MKSKSKQIIVFLILSFSLIFGSNTLSQSINLENVILNTTNKDVTIQVFLNFIESKKLKKMIKHKKYQVVFSYRVEIQKKMKFFLHKTVFASQREWYICYNPINNKFSLKRKHKQIYSTNSLAKLLEKIRTINLKLPLWTTPTGKEKYELVLKFSLKKKVPYWIEKTLFFWNFDITPPSEYHIDFKF